MYMNMGSRYLPAIRITENINPKKIAIPPRFGVELRCELRLFCFAKRCFIFEIWTTMGIDLYVTPNATRKPKKTTVKGGK